MCFTITSCLISVKWDDVTEFAELRFIDDCVSIETVVSGR